jgi:hypothetical protein
MSLLINQTLTPSPWDQKPFLDSTANAIFVIVLERLEKSRFSKPFRLSGGDRFFPGNGCRKGAAGACIAPETGLFSKHGFG